MTGRRLAGLHAALVAFSVVAGARPAAGYEFEIDSKAVGQGYQLRWLRFSEPDRLINRRRFTQLLRLSIWDILAPRNDPARPSRKWIAPVNLSFETSLRLDHDFGEFGQGRTRYPVVASGVPILVEEDARAVVPELGEDDLELDVAYAYLAARDVGGFLDARLGRQLMWDTLDAFALDGLSARARTPWRFAVDAHGGLMVRGASWFGRPTGEPDGTSSAGCLRFDEDTGEWALPAAEQRECDQREALMPALGVGVETDGVRGVRARVSYRRAWSSTSEEAYPAFAPGSGVNEEKLAATVRGNFLEGGVSPWLATRWNFVLAQVDEAQAGVRLAWRGHAVTPEVAYAAPSFDGDSIFNVFAQEAYRDARVRWDGWPGRGAWRAAARLFVRAFDGGETAAGGGAGGRWRGERGEARVDLHYEDGWGGLRTGGDAGGRVRVRRDLEAEGRLTVIRYLRTRYSAQGGARLALGEGMALHLLVEGNVDPGWFAEVRVTGVLDLAFVPEL